MIIYATIVCGLHVLGLGYQIGNSNAENASIVMLRLFTVLPLAGRVFGWW